jgi:hypothetical protein
MAHGVPVRRVQDRLVEERVGHAPPVGVTVWLGGILNVCAYVTGWATCIEVQPSGLCAATQPLTSLKLVSIEGLDRCVERLTTAAPYSATGGMMICAGCRESLNRSQYREDGLKSCPKCSLRAGQHVFYRLGHFGMRRPARATEPIMQSWCRDCRAERVAAVAVDYCAAPVRTLPRVIADGAQTGRRRNESAPRQAR